MLTLKKSKKIKLKHQINIPAHPNVVLFNHHSSYLSMLFENTGEKFESSIGIFIPVLYFNISRRHCFIENSFAMIG